MKLTDSEKEIIDFVSLLSNVSPAICKEVYLNLMLIIAINLKRDNKEIDLPYIGTLKLEYEKIGKKFDLKDAASLVLSNSLKTMCLDILNKKDIVLKKYVQQEILRSLAEKLGISDEELEAQGEQLELFS